MAAAQFPTALAALEERRIITVRHGGTHQQNRYQVNWHATICASFSDAPTANGASNSEAQAPLNLMHSASETEAPADPAAMPLPRARETSNSDFAVPNETLDRVFQSELRDFDKTTIEYFGRRLHSYMAKFGRHNAGPAEGRLYIDTPGDPPEPPDKTITARFLAISTPQGLANLLDDLWRDAGQAMALRPNQENAYQPRRYAWFVTTALAKIHKIHWSTTAQATADWHVHQKSQQPRTTAQLQGDITRLARTKGMDRR